jgi:hypothetical protein
MFGRRPAWPTAVSDFTQQLATIEEQHGEQLQQLVETFRIRNAELRKERYNLLKDINPKNKLFLFDVCQKDWEIFQNIPNVLTVRDRVY